MTRTGPRGRVSPGSAGTATAGLRAALLLVTLLVGAACGGGDDAGSPDPGRDSTTAAASDTNTAGSAAAESGAEVSAEAPAADSARPLRAFRVRLRNRSGDSAVVVADAGAGVRTLDTVPPADSSEVRVETRARRLEIRARGPDGEVGSSDRPARSRYELEQPAADSVIEFEVPPPPAADTTG